MGFISVECMVMMIQGLPLSVARKNFKGLVTVESGKGLRQPQANPNVKSMILPNHFCSQIRPYREQLCNSVNTSDFITAGDQLGSALDKQTAVPFFSAFSQMMS